MWKFLTESVLFWKHWRMFCYSSNSVRVLGDNCILQCCLLLYFLSKRQNITGVEMGNVDVPTMEHRHQVEFQSDSDGQVCWMSFARRNKVFLQWILSYFQSKSLNGFIPQDKIQPLTLSACPGFGPKRVPVSVWWPTNSLDVNEEIINGTIRVWLCLVSVSTDIYHNKLLE